MVTTLEVPETEVPETDTENELEQTAEPETSEASPEETPAADVPPPELAPDEKIAAYIRKENELREAQLELNSLENQQADARREMNSCKKSISETRAKVERLIRCDVSGFLRWEKEQELPLLQKAEEAENAWKQEPVSKLDVSEKRIENLTENGFETIGQLSEWLGKEFKDKKKGLGAKAIEDLGDAVNKFVAPYHSVQEEHIQKELLA